MPLPFKCLDLHSDDHLKWRDVKKNSVLSFRATNIDTPIINNFWTRLSKISSLIKQPTFGDATTGFAAKWRLQNERRNSILMARHYPDLGSASDWSYRVGNLIQPIRSTTQIWVMTRHQYGISALVSQTSFGGETSGSVTKCRLFSQVTKYPDLLVIGFCQKNVLFEPNSFWETDFFLPERTFW